MKFLLSLCLLLALSQQQISAQNVQGDCSAVYSETSTNCDAGCGSCFNPNGRSTTADFDVVMCPEGESPGYFCNPEGGSFACMDWTFGSRKMMEQEEKFNARTGDNVWFGVGTFGTTADAMQGLGNCYRLSVVDTDCGNDPHNGNPLERQIIAQSINTGHDVANIQFDLQMGNGGTGAFNNCAGSSWSMFPGPFDEATWGHQYGGCDYRDETEGSPSCDDLPPYPQDPAMMAAQGDNLVDLCKYSFDKRVRLGSANPTIVDMARVDCPAELVEMTQTQRTDEPGTFVMEEANRPVEYQNGAPGLEPCKCSCGANECKYCLTRMMDCRKPSAGFTDNMHTELLADGMKVVQPCTQDGYTRIDVKCGCMDCYC